jgi:hypothetical protein
VVGAEGVAVARPRVKLFEHNKIYYSRSAMGGVLVYRKGFRDMATDEQRSALQTALRASPLIRIVGILGCRGPAMNPTG